MLTISSKSKYGLQAILTLAGHYGQGVLQIKDISALNRIPQQYLVQIFNLLVKADLIKSVRGKNGGYNLARPPAEILALEVLDLLEGGISFADPGDVGVDAVSELLFRAETSLRDAFRVSLADLLLRQQEKGRVLMFDI